MNCNQIIPDSSITSIPHAFTKELYNTKQMDNSTTIFSIRYCFFFIHLAYVKVRFFILNHPVFSLTSERITPEVLEPSIEDI